MKYPFEPKSTSYIEPGQYWAIPLSNGKHACGIVVAKLADLQDGKIRTRTFLGALIDWSGSELPTERGIENQKIIKLGEAHLKAIHTTGGSILGQAKFENLGSNPRVKTDDIVTMGYGVLLKIAENRFVKNS